MPLKKPQPTPSSHPSQFTPGPSRFFYPEMTDWDRPSSLKGPSLCSRISSTLHTAFDRLLELRPEPTAYTPSNTRRTYRRAQRRFERLRTHIRELFTSSKVPHTVHLERSHGLGPDDPPDTNVFTDQLQPEPQLTRELSFIKIYRPPDAPLLPDRRAARSTATTVYSQRPRKLRQRIDPLGTRNPIRLSGSTAAGTIHPSLHPSLTSVQQNPTHNSEIHNIERDFVNSTGGGYCPDYCEAWDPDRDCKERNDEWNKDIVVKSEVAEDRTRLTLPTFDLDFEKPGSWISYSDSILV